MGRICVWKKRENRGKERLEGLWFARRHVWVLDRRIAKSGVNANASDERI